MGLPPPAPRIKPSTIPTYVSPVCGLCRHPRRYPPYLSSTIQTSLPVCFSKTRNVALPPEAADLNGRGSGKTQTRLGRS